MNAVVKIEGKPSLLATMASRYGVDPVKMQATLRATAFRGDVTDEQLMALCIVAQQYNLNPWTKEIYAFPDRTGIVPVVGVDGWARIINDHSQCDGIQFKDAEDGSWIECTIHRKDRQFPTTVREYMNEVRRESGPWKSHPHRMLRHKALIQCARVVFGFSGIYDQDEAERIIDVTPEIQASPHDGFEPQDPSVIDGYVSQIADIKDQDIEEDAKADRFFAVHLSLNPHHDLYDAVLLKMRKGKVLSKSAWDAYVAMGSKQFQARNVA